MVVLVASLEAVRERRAAPPGRVFPLGAWTLPSSDREPSQLAAPLMAKAGLNTARPALSAKPLWTGTVRAPVAVPRCGFPFAFQESALQCRRMKLKLAACIFEDRTMYGSESENH